MSAQDRRERMIAVAFGPKTMAEACAGLARIRQQGPDCIEIRLDFFEEPFDLPVLFRERGNLPVVATLRPPDQGGHSALSKLERLERLVQAAELGAEYIDLEYDAASREAIDQLHAAGAQVIVSRHDFDAMPPDLADGWWPALAKLGADVVKVVGTARDVRDGLHVFRALQGADRPTIAIAMGDPGVMTRVLALRSDHCLLTYASLDAGIGTAPGQLTIADMRHTYRADRLGASTRAYALLGPHLEHDRIAEYNAWFARDGIDGVSVPFIAQADAAAIVAAYRELPVSGWHIHGTDLQRDVLHSLDDLTPKAATQNKANAIVRRGRDGSLVGHWVESPREQYELWIQHSA